jgi:hypothetical protein
MAMGANVEALRDLSVLFVQHDKYFASGVSSEPNA